VTAAKMRKSKNEMTIEEGVTHLKTFGLDGLPLEKLRVFDVLFSNEDVTEVHPDDREVLRFIASYAAYQGVKTDQKVDVVMYGTCEGDRVMSYEVQLSFPVEDERPVLHEDDLQKYRAYGGYRITRPFTIGYNKKEDRMVLKMHVNTHCNPFIVTQMHITNITVEGTQAKPVESRYVYTDAEKPSGSVKRQRYNNTQ
jgi:hypothetical protein